MNLLVDQSYGHYFQSYKCSGSISIGNPERHMCKALHCGNKQQWRSCAAISLTIACSR